MKKMKRLMAALMAVFMLLGNVAISETEVYSEPNHTHEETVEQAAEHNDHAADEHDHAPADETAGGDEAASAESSAPAGEIQPADDSAPAEPSESAVDSASGERQAEAGSDEPAEEQTEEPAAESGQEAVEEAAESDQELVEDSAEEPIEEAAEEIAEEPIEVDSEDPTEKPAEETMEEPAQEPIEEPAGEPAEEPTEVENSETGDSSEMPVVVDVPLMRAAAPARSASAANDCLHSNLSSFTYASDTQHSAWCDDCKTDVYGTHGEKGNLYEADCVNQAVCGTCYSFYGDTDPNGHASDYGTIWFLDLQNEAQHYTYCQLCVEITCEKHTPNANAAELACTEEVKCSKCNYWMSVGARHGEYSGWIASNDEEHYKYCLQCNSSRIYEEHGYDGSCKPTCSECGQTKNNPDGQHTPGDWYYIGHNGHKRLCSICGRLETIETEPHTPSDEYCVTTCTVCNSQYTNYASENPTHTSMGDWEYANDNQHARYCIDCYGPQYEDHTGGTATCYSLAACEVCKTYYGEPDTINGHEWNEWVGFNWSADNTSATATVKCGYCGEQKTEAVSVNIRTSGEVTCTTGIMTYWKVSYTMDNGVTKGFEKSRVTTPALQHDWSDWSDEGDQHSRVCLREGCGQPDSGNHSFANPKVEWVVKPESAQVTLECTTCQKPKTEPLEVTQEVTQEATCTQYKKVKYTANYEGTFVSYEAAVEGSMLDHVPGKEATCTEDQVCTREGCGVVLVEKLGHTPGDEATCAENQVCTRTGCGIVLTEKLGHIPGNEATCTEDQICTREGCGVVLTEKLGHIPGNEATCTEDQICTREGCGVVLTEKLGHIPGDEATCTEDQVCTRTGCGVVLTEKLGHVPGDEVTCTEDQICTRTGCSVVLTEKLGHIPGDEATCTEDQICTRTGCGVVLAEKFGHIPGDEATCTEDQVCTREGCGIALVEKLGHAPGEEATCTENQVCTRTGCGIVLVEQLGHKPGDDATCTEDQICTRTGCGVVLTEKPGHIPGDEATCTEDQVCTREGCGVVLTEKLGHIPGEEATCTEDQICTRTSCGIVLVEKLGHIPGDEATCTEDQVCTRTDCGVVLTEKLGHIPGDDATCTEDQVCTRTGCGVVLTEKLGHIPGDEATCTEDQVCTRKGCGIVLIEKLGHDYKTVTTKPNCTKQGGTTHTCTRCGDSYVTGQVKARGHWYDLWTPNEDGTHSANCKRNGCDHVGTTDCTLYEVTVMDGENEVILTVCPVCGDHEDTPFEVVLKAVIEAVDRDALPRGEQIVRGMDTPFNGALYAFTAAYEYAGDVEPFNGIVSVTLPLDEEKYTEFELVRVDVTPATETTERIEVWTDIAFTFVDGKLSFETETAGLFLLVLVE